jgi:uncharacterized protein DUF4153
VGEGITKNGRLLAAPVILGILADALLRAMPWGLNVFLWVFLLTGLIVWIAHDKIELWTRGDAWLVLPSVLFAAGFVWRDSRTLAAADLFALWVTASLAVLRAQGGRIFVAGLADYALGAVVASVNAVLGGPLFALKVVPWEGLARGRAWSRALALGVGLLLALPPAILFSILFAKADPVFQDLLRKAFHFDFLTLLSHAFLFGFFAWTTAGLLRGLLLGKELAWAKEVQPPRISLGIIELSVVLATVDLIFSVFVIIQFRYFFGGPGLVQATTGLTYAEYARRGFFELVAASALVLPLLLASHWLLGKKTPREERIFRILAGVLLALVFVVLVSAFERMRLYQAEYGMTELRLYTTAFMGWLALLLIWFASTVLAGRREHFAGGALIAGYALIVALHAANPNSLIAQVNTARARAGERFDARYVASLGADAIPALVAALPDLTPAGRCVIRNGLLKSWTGSDPSDWRSWNASREAARKTIRDNLSMLMNLPCPDSKIPSPPKQ